MTDTVPPPHQSDFDRLDRHIERARMWQTLAVALAFFGFGYAVIQALQFWATGQLPFAFLILLGLWVLISNIATFRFWRRRHKRMLTFRHSMIGVLNAQNRSALICAMDQADAAFRDL